MKAKSLFGLVLKIAIVIAFFVAVSALAYGGWHLERRFNWKLGYGGEVQKVVAPLEARVAELERQVKALQKEQP